ncbi:MAG: hypothetical protein IT322_11160 [Anaerolineae bacterium]|nr:hypothetical protein [Anaerolineae bacterium]
MESAIILMQWANALLPPAIPAYYGTLPKPERNQLIRTRYTQGQTMEALAREFKITVQRVEQIINAHLR